MDIAKLAEFCVLLGKYKLLRLVCNQAVEAHFRTTPSSSTEDTFNTIVQEQLRTLIRKLEQRCHTIKERYEDIGKELLHD